jgi:uncharacterized protein (DUF697 family)
MSQPSDVLVAAQRLIAILRKVNKLASDVLPEDIEKIVKRHAKIAIGTAFIPIGGLDVVAATANIWTMYISINKALGLNFSDNVMKSIGSAIVSNIIQNLGIMAVIAALKWNPLSWPVSVAILTTSLYALTMVSGWVYLTALANLSQYDDDITLSVKSVLKRKSDISKIFNNHKK